MATARFSLTLDCPMNSASRCGRSFNSNEESSSTGAADTSRCFRSGMFLRVGTLQLRRLFFADPLADLDNDLSRALIGVHDYVVSMKYLAVEDLESQQILHQLLDRPLQRPRAKVRVEALGEQNVLGRFGKLE